MQRLLNAGNSNAIIRGQVATKEMWDTVMQDMHSKTLSSCFLLETCSKKPFPEIIFLDMMEEVMERESRGTFTPQNCCVAFQPSARRYRHAAQTFRTKDGAHA